MVMPSRARESFEANRKDVERLLEIHGDLAGDTPGRKHGVEVLNKSGVVLTCAIWEAYCEDLAAEAVEHLVKHAADPSALPKDLQKRIAAEMKSAKNQLAMWNLAGDGWRKVLGTRLKAFQEQRNRKLNTPKAANIEALFAEAVGLPKVSGAWSWKGMSAKSARKKLDDYVTLRGAVAHRARAAGSVKKADVEGFLNHAERLVEKTDDHVSGEIAAACGVPLF